MSLTAPPDASADSPASMPEGVRTYRGKSLAELIPKIRKELGPDAIILREREGLIGGVNGFFAKRCVEVEARSATPRIDVYDDDEPETVAAGEPVPAATPAPARAPAPAPAPAHAPAPVNAPSPAPALAPARADALAPAPAHAPAPAPAHAPAPANPPEAEHEPDVASEPETVEPSIEIAPWSQIARESIADVIADQQSFADQLLAAQEPSETEDPANEEHDEPVPPAPPPVPAEPPAPASELPRPARKLTMPAPRAKRPRRFDASAAAAIARELVGRGISQTEAARLVSEAAAHSSPFAPQGGLRDAVRRALANKLPRPITPPSHGAAIAIVGAGGAGKTSAAAALCAAYGRGSTLSVTAVSLGGPDRGGALKALLKRERVDVKFAAVTTRAVIQRMHKRAGAMIVVDTVAASGSQDAVAALASELDSLSLDAVYVAVPATLGAPAARQLFERLLPLSPTGIVITHADETDQLGIVAELSCSTGIPIAYVLEGPSLHGALTAPDPTDVARRLLS